MGKSHDLATLKDDGGTFKSSLVIDTGTNGTPNIDFKHANSSADQFRLQAGTPAVTNGGFSIYDIDASQTRLNIDASGRVTMPYQPTFEAHSAQGNNAGGSGVQTWTARLNVGNHFNGTQFTAPISGYYQINWGVLSRSGTYIRADLQVNGSDLIQTENTSTTLYRTCGGSVVTHLAANDTVRVSCGSYNSYGGKYNFFSGRLVG